MLEIVCVVFTSIFYSNFVGWATTNTASSANRILRTCRCCYKTTDLVSCVSTHVSSASLGKWKAWTRRSCQLWHS